MCATLKRMKMKTLRDANVQDKCVLVRVDYNVPVDDGVVGDLLRIQASIPTIKYLLDQNCAIVLISHLGRPEGKADPKYSLAPVAVKLAEILAQPVEFASDCVGDDALEMAKDLNPKEILFLENLRFHPEEEAGDEAFAKTLAKLGEYYVNDAFAVAHRAHASITGIPKYLPSAAGLLLEKEVETISQAVSNPQRPLLGISGGAKVSDKIEFLDSLLSKVDALLIGGAMANTFLKVAGNNVGKSLVEDDHLDTTNQIMADAKSKNVELILPVDVVVTADAEAATEVKTVGLAEILDTDIIADIGPETVHIATKYLSATGSVWWNGTVGIAETPEFAHGSRSLADAIIASGCYSLVGGGDTAAFIDAAGLHDKFSFVSTGGGASLELLSGKTLPGVEALMDS